MHFLSTVLAATLATAFKFSGPITYKDNLGIITTDAELDGQKLDFGISFFYNEVIVNTGECRLQEDTCAFKHTFEVNGTAPTTGELTGEDGISVKVPIHVSEGESEFNWIGLGAGLKYNGSTFNGSLTAQTNNSISEYLASGGISKGNSSHPGVLSALASSGQISKRALSVYFNKQDNGNISDATVYVGEVDSAKLNTSGLRVFQVTNWGTDGKPRLLLTDLDVTDHLKKKPTDISVSNNTYWARIDLEQASSSFPSSLFNKWQNLTHGLPCNYKDEEKVPTVTITFHGQTNFTLPITNVTRPLSNNTCTSPFLQKSNTTEVVLGQDFFSNFYLIIDYDQGVVAFSPIAVQQNETKVQNVTEIEYLTIVEAPPSTSVATTVTETENTARLNVAASPAASWALAFFGSLVMFVV